ncbi:CsgG/HfaB family protein [Sphingomonas xinjiangensis]|uniref:Curli biogenesis system outer membrane secretion channel CsgG n=1 Tax=Sphingomonas xinjiangensis TaxID=643568 RepID=A0A840YSU8_9SPHN|nr:CsgG/HfaB family protein [Sphingomonas xinjiangensis]MBB5712748.1 hypothetical protein [Sphingomonas xinjiangensis]
MPAQAQKLGKGGTGVDETSEVPRCAQPFGTMAIVEKRSAAPSAQDLPPGMAALVRMAEAQNGGGAARVDPIPLLKLLTAQSNCFQIVDRGEGFDALQRERELAAGGSVANGANTATLRAADYLLHASVVYSDGNAGGSGGGIGGMFGGAIGFKSKKLESQVVLTLVEVKTGIQQAIATGQVRKKDLSILGGGLLLNAGIGALGGGYTNTDMGKITSLALLDAYRKLALDARTRLTPVVASAPAPVPAPAPAVPQVQPLPVSTAPGVR